MRTLSSRSIPVALLLLALTACTERPRLAGSFDVPAPDSSRVLKVSGTGRMSLPPSQVSFDCVVEVTAPTSDAAWNQSSVRITKLSKALEAAAVPPGDLVLRDIQMAQLGPEGPDKPEAWRLTQTLNVALNDLKRLPGVLTVVMGAGAGVVRNARFGIADTRAAGDRARERALIEARTKAEMLAQEVNLRLGAVRSVEEQDLSALSAPGSLDAPPGSFEVVTRIEVTYELID